MKSSSYISIDPVFSVRTVDPYRTSSQPWTNSLYNTKTTANPYGSDNIFIANSHHHHGYSNNTFHTRQQYQEMLDCPQCSLNDYKANIPSINRVDIYGDYERMEENLQGNQLHQRDRSKISESLILGERRPFQDLTNQQTSYVPSFHNDFNSRINAKEIGMAHYSRPIVFNAQPEQVKNVSYSNEAYLKPLQRENCNANPHLGVNNIVGRKKGKSLNLIKRNRPGLDIDTSYNSNAHVLIIPADDGMDLKNLLHDSYTTRAGFMEMKRG